MSLQNKIRAFNEETVPNIPEEIAEIMGRAAKDLAESGIVNKALSTGDTLPSFSLPDIHGKKAHSEDLLARGPLVISFYRGSW